MRGDNINMKVFNIRISDELEAKMRPHVHYKGDVSKAFSEGLELWIQSKLGRQTPADAIADLNMIQEHKAMAELDKNVREAVC